MAKHLKTHVMRGIDPIASRYLQLPPHSAPRTRDIGYFIPVITPAKRHNTRNRQKEMPKTSVWHNFCCMNWRKKAALIFYKILLTL